MVRGYDECIVGRGWLLKWSVRGCLNGLCNWVLWGPGWGSPGEGFGGEWKRARRK